MEQIYKRKERESYVDIAKGLAMITIVCGHIECFWFPNWFTSFWPVAFFFVVAGFYIQEQKLFNPVQFVKNKLRTIYLPGTIIYLIAILLHNPLCQWGIYPLGGMHPMTHKEFELWDVKMYLLQIAKTIVAPNGELAMGAMWFLYALFFALCILSVSAYVSLSLTKNKVKSMLIWIVILVFISTISVSLKIYGISIPRISQSMTITIFIFTGLMLKQKLNMKFDNWIMVIIAGLIYLQCIVLPHPHSSFPLNSFPDIVLPLSMSVSSLYIILFVSKRIDKFVFLSKVLRLIGRDSLYIMALHIFGLFICTQFINLLGLNTNLAMAVTLYTYDVGNNIILGILYLFFGITIPLVSMYLFRFLKGSFVEYNRRFYRNDRKN